MYIYLCALVRNLSIIMAAGIQNIRITCEIITHFISIYRACASNKKDQDISNALKSIRK